MRRVLLLFAVAVLLGIVLAVWWAGRSTRPWLEEYASEALGRTVHIDGAVRPLFSLYPGLHLGRVRVDNPPGSAEPVLLEVAAVEARLDLPALLHRELRVRGVRLRRGRLVVGGAVPAGTQAITPGAQLALLRSLAGEQRVRDLALEIVLEDGSRHHIALERASLGACGEPLEARVRLPRTTLELAGTLVCRPEGPAFDPVSLRVGDSELRGRLALRLKASGLRVEGEIGAQEIVVGELLAVLPQEGDDEGPEGLDAPLPFDALEHLDLDLGVNAEALYADAGVLRGLDGRLRAAPGSLDLDLERAQLAGGSLAGELHLDAGPEGPAAALDASLAGADLAALVPEAFAEGSGGITVDLTGRGATPRALLASSSGRSQITLEEAVLTGQAFGALGRDLFSLLSFGADEQPGERLSCGVLRAELERGSGALLAVVDTPRVTLAGAGSLDLGFLSVDLLLRPRPRRASLGAVKTPIRISGPLASLHVGVDKSELAMATGRALGLALLNPLVALVDLGVRGHPCQEAIDQALDQLPSEPPAAGAPLAD
jgi:hypothetical protein